MAQTRNHLIGLLLGAEEDWPTAFEELLKLVGPITTGTAFAALLLSFVVQAAVWAWLKYR